MAKKYLSLEEAAAILGIKPDDLVRLRERAEIRGFADRGTWKFKSEDVEEFRRQRHPDSNPDVPLFMDDSSSEVSVLGADSDEVADQPTVIRGDSSGKVLDGASDSDVRLIVDDNLVGGGPDSDPEVALPPLSDTDSDVRLLDEHSGRAKHDSDSDSDVVLSTDDSDSDVKLVGSDSDSDVRLVGHDSSTGDTDSDVALVDINEDTQPMKLKKKGPDSSSVLADDSTLRRSVEDSGLTLESESGLALSEPDSGKLAEFDSGITLDSSDSGISLDSVDSGISLDTGDSGISLDAGDSGISLEMAGDSGISLDDSGSYALADDSGIEVGSPSDSGIALDAIDTADSGKLARTAPMDSSGNDDLEVTQMEMDSTDIQKPRGKDAETSVILFDDEDSEPPKAKGKGKAKAAPASSVEDFDTLESQTFGLDDSFVEAVDFEDQDLEVVEDVLGDSSADFDEDIESLEEMDVFDAADEDFEDQSFVAGGSEGEFTPSPATSGRMMVPVEANWGTGTFVGLVISSLCMVVCAMMMFDLVRSMWTYQEPTTFGGIIIDTFKGFFGKG